MFFLLLAGITGKDMMCSKNPRPGGPKTKTIQNLDNVSAASLTGCPRQTLMPEKATAHRAVQFTLVIK
jgi:hypothetical protein